MESKDKVSQEKTKNVKAYVIGILVLILAVLIFSGLFTDAAGPLKVLDFSNLLGKFGGIFENVSFRGKGGVSARDGFLFAVTLAPTTMLAMGLIQVFENYGALDAAAKLLTPILKFLIGVPGIASLALVGSFNSSDAGAAMTRELYDNGKITEDERDIFTTFQYSSSGLLVNYFGGGSALFGIITVGVGVPFLYLIVLKAIQANLMRLIIWFENKKGVADNGK